jgi:uncharacterized protein
VYSLKIGENWIRINLDVPGRELPQCDYEVHPTTPWNYGLYLDAGNLSAGLVFEEKPIGAYPFSPEMDAQT